MPNQKLPRKKASQKSYLMESEDETIRLEIKTDPEALKKQAMCCGIKPGMRVLDVACGPGKTTAILHDMVQPGGSIVGIDFSEERIKYASEQYGKTSGIEFKVHDFRDSLEVLGKFDFIWVRFVLEYYRKEALQIVGNFKNALRTGGTLCLLDLDYNCLTHYELTPEMEKILQKIMKVMDQKFNFDTYIGRKLYSFLYDHGFENIQVELMAHNLFFGEIKEKDVFNISKKIEIAAKKSPDVLAMYNGGYKKFFADFTKYIQNKRRFSYTPLLICKGIKPFVS